MEGLQPVTQHGCVMTGIIQEIKDEQVEQKISLATLTGEVTRLVTAVSDLVTSQKKDDEYKLTQKDKKIDGFNDVVKSLILLVAGFLLAQFGVK